MASYGPVTITRGTKGTPTRTNTSPVSSSSGPTGIASSQPPLQPEQLAELLARRRGASSGYQSEMATGNERSAFLRSNAQRSAIDRNSRYDQVTRDAMASFGDRGMAFQPIGAGQGLRQVRDAEAQDSAGAEYELAVQLAEVAEQVAAARRNRDLQLAQLEEQEQQWRSQMIRDELANFA